MTTFVLPAITNPQVIVNNSGVTRISGVENNAVVLHDFLGYRENATSRSDPRNYPLRVLSAAQGVLYDRINFRGNIPADMPWENWYGQTGFLSFNGTALQHAPAVVSEIRDCVWGIRDDLSSGGADCIHHKFASCTITRPRVWCWRDDWFEIDVDQATTTPASPINITINDGFFENLFVWLSGTGNMSQRFFYVNNCLVHFRRWLYRPGLENGVMLKVSSSAWSPKFRFNNVCMVVSAHNTLDNNRIRWAMSQTQAVNGCRLLVLGGIFPDRTVITAFQNAGFSVLEDGSGDAATQEWLNRKAAFLGEGQAPPPPPPTPTLTSPATFSVQVGA